MDEQEKVKPTKAQVIQEQLQDNAELGSGSLAVILVGLATYHGIPLSPEMIAAGSGLLVGIGNRIKERFRRLRE